jgi:hypothetical protein
MALHSTEFIRPVRLLNQGSSEPAARAPPVASRPGQGLLPSDEMLGASGATATALANVHAAANKQWKSAVTWQQAVKATPKAACVGTSRDSLCSSAASQGARHFVRAAAPQVSLTGGRDRIGTHSAHVLHAPIPFPLPAPVRIHLLRLRPTTTRRCREAGHADVCDVARQL